MPGMALADAPVELRALIQAERAAGAADFVLRQAGGLGGRDIDHQCVGGPAGDVRLAHMAAIVVGRIGDGGAGQGENGRLRIAAVGRGEGDQRRAPSLIAAHRREGIDEAGERLAGGIGEGGGLPVATGGAIEQPYVVRQGGFVDRPGAALRERGAIVGRKQGSGVRGAEAGAREAGGLVGTDGCAGDGRCLGGLRIVARLVGGGRRAGAQRCEQHAEGQVAHLGQSCLR